MLLEISSGLCCNVCLVHKFFGRRSNTSHFLQGAVQLLVAKAFHACRTGYYFLPSTIGHVVHRFTLNFIMCELRVWNSLKVPASKILRCDVTRSYLIKNSPETDCISITMIVPVVVVVVVVVVVDTWHGPNQERRVPEIVTESCKLRRF